ncbi:FIMAH domain-containing protein [Paenibacillus cineris]|uniref:FIMAH domain-containing protein n=1 Tax=Paenibacillus cineris TaxID=237530 RepID=UPI003570B0C5
MTTGPASIQQLIDRYSAAGDLGGGLVPQLTNALKQAQHQWDGGKPDQAVKHLQDFLKHLDNKGQSGNIKDDAKAVLTADINAVIAQWQGTGK